MGSPPRDQQDHRTNLFHHAPAGTASVSRQIASTVAASGRPVAVAQTERHGTAEVTLFHSDDRGAIGRTRLSTEGGPKPHQPRIARGRSGRCLVAWNACLDDEWQILFTSFDDAPTRPGRVHSELVHRSRQVAFPPAIADNGDTICVVWAEEKDGHFRVHSSCRAIRGDQWSAPMLLSSDSTDCLRPCIVPLRDGWLVAWDRLADGTHAVQYAIPSPDRVPAVVTLKHPRESWLAPRCVADRQGNTYLAWLAVSPVRHDALGVYDHQTATICAKIEGDVAQILEDPDSPWDTRFAADLREGLLATEVHLGHHGLRRNIQPCIWNDRLWLCWELRREAERTQARGFLVGREWDGDAWSPVVLLHSDKLSYSLPSNLDRASIPVFFADLEQTGNVSVQCDTVDLTRVGTFARRDVQEWAQWQPAPRVAIPCHRESLEVGGEELHLFWADTHCHSAFSSDAEGELTELVAVGRDLAGLDIMAIVDNDYYPFKALTEAEWHIILETARHYTQPGEFVMLPAYEYTYWHPPRNGKQAGLNHRYVLYPSTGGPLVRRIDADGADDGALMRALQSTDAQLVAHHTTWELLDPSLDRSVEVCSSWRIYIEECDFVRRQLQAGRKFGFVGSSDTHRMVPGLGGALTGVFATDLTPEAVLDAYRRRRLIATSGARISIDLRVGDQFIGADGQVAGAPRVAARVGAPREIERMEVLRDCQVIRHLTPDADTCEVTFDDGAASVGSHFYFVRVKLVGDPSFNIGPEAPQSYQTFRIDGPYAGNWARADGCFGWCTPVWVERTS